MLQWHLTAASRNWRMGLTVSPAPLHGDSYRSPSKRSRELNLFEKLNLEMQLSDKVHRLLFRRCTIQHHLPPPREDPRSEIKGRFSPGKKLGNIDGKPSVELESIAWSLWRHRPCISGNCIIYQCWSMARCELPQFRIVKPDVSLTQAIRYLWPASREETDSEGSGFVQWKQWWNCGDPLCVTPILYLIFSSFPVAANDVDHSRIRRLMSHAFSESALREQEPILNSYFDLLIQKLHEKVSGSENGKVNMVHWFNFTTFDLIGDLVSPFFESVFPVSGDWQLFALEIYFCSQVL